MTLEHEQRALSLFVHKNFLKLYFYIYNNTHFNNELHKCSFGELYPTFKQTKRVLGMLQKLPGPESILLHNMMPYFKDKYGKYFCFKHIFQFNLT